MTQLRTISLLSEGITHLEDLDVSAFVRAVANITKMQATEKLDGAELSFGLDKDGKFYTTRAAKRKGAEPVYNESDYPYFAAYNGFRAAHAALKSVEAEIKQVIRPNDMVEIEVLYGRQPNAVTYGAGGKNYIAFLRGLESTPDMLVDQLANRLANHIASVRVQTVDTVDGENLKLLPTEVTFQFVGVQKIDTTHLKATDVSKQLDNLQRFLRTKTTIGLKTMTNFDLATASLGSFDKTERAAAKLAKAQVLATIMTDFKLPIKKELLDKFVGKVKSPLASDDLTQDEDIGIEGVVLKDPENGEQIKIVDKDTFTTINTFNHAVRSSISGVVKTTDPQASIEARGGLLGELKLTIADLLGNIDLARGGPAKKIFQTVKGKTPEETVRNVANELHGNEDYRSTRTKIIALIDATRQKLLASLKDFKANKDQFQLKLKGGRTIGLSAEIIRRTLLAFAEAKRDLDELGGKIGKTQNLPQLVALLYGRTAKAVHEAPEEEEKVAESLTESQVWSITLHPDEGIQDQAEQEELMVQQLKKLGKVKLVRLFDEDGEGGGFEFELTTKKDFDEDDIWNVLADADIEYGGNVSLKEDLITEKREHSDMSMYKGRDAANILCTYIASYLMAGLIYREKDKPGMRLLRDKTHMRLQKFDMDMGALNFWGYPVWRSGTPAVKKLLGPKVAKQLFSVTRRVPPQLWKFIHIDLSYGRETPIEWEDHRKVFRILQIAPGLNVERINTLLDGMMRYDELTFDEKVKFQTKLFYLVSQFVGNSPLLTRLRAIMSATLLAAGDQAAQNGDMVQEMKLLQSISKITEDGEGPIPTPGSAPIGTAPLAQAQNAAATNAGAIGSYVVPGTGREIVKRRRTFKHVKFEAPKDMKKDK
jgi:hypothetical protein